MNSFDAHLLAGGYKLTPKQLYQRDRIERIWREVTKPPTNTELAATTTEWEFWLRLLNDRNEQE
jgi:hypothetical protein